MEATKSELEDLKVNGEKAFVDYVGQNSKKPPKPKAAVVTNVNPKKLYVSNFTKSVTKEEIKEAFTGCSEVDLPMKSGVRAKRRYCFVYYDEESLAKKAFENASNIKLGDRAVYVQFAKDKVAQKRKKTQKPSSESPAKKQKVDASAQKKKGKATVTKDKEDEEKVKEKAKKASKKEEEEDDESDDESDDDEMDAEDDDNEDSDDDEDEDDDNDDDDDDDDDDEDDDEDDDDDDDDDE